MSGALLALVLVASGAAAAGAKPVSKGDTLTATHALKVNTALVSADGRSRAVLQRDGNFVVYGIAGAVWSTSTSSASQVVLQADGNLVAYTAARTAVWASATATSHDDRLVMQNDGRLVLYSGAGVALWANGASLQGADTLAVGQQLGVNQPLLSRDGHYSAVLQGDGNFVIYGPSGAGWNTGGGAATHLVLQGDGNLVAYAASGAATWSSATANSRNDHLIMQGDGNLVIYSGNGIALWSNGNNLQGGDTLVAGQQLGVNQALYSADGRYSAVLQGDGNFVVYGPSGAAWNTGPGAANRVAMQSDGNLVAYDPGGRATWSSGTAPSSNDRLVMQSDGNLVIYSGAALWSNGRAIGTPPTTCQSSAYTCTPGYTAGNTAGTWAWTYYGGSIAQTPTGLHNCTLYAAWRLGQNGMADPGRSWGNATQWASAIGGANHSPAVGSIAWWSAGSGHVAYVEQISGGNVFIRADNYSTSGGYTNSRWIAASAVDGFLHPHDLGA